MGRKIGDPSAPEKRCIVTTGAKGLEFRVMGSGSRF